MVTTRSSQGSLKSFPPSSSALSKKSNKRSAEASSSPPAKRGKTGKAAPKNGRAIAEGKGKGKKQKTIEEMMEDDDGAEETIIDADDIEDDGDVEMQIDGEDETGDEEENGKENTIGKDSSGGDENSEEKGDGIMKDKEDEVQARKDSEKEENGVVANEKNAFDEVKADAGEVKEAAKQEQEEKSAEINENNESVIEDDKRETMMPSSILEKGVIYFFFRGRIGVEEPQGIEDVARSYIILRPLPLGAKLGDGQLKDIGNARMLALPKKMLPKSRKDRFLVFVEKAKTHIKDLREQFASNDYSTKTSGTSHVPAATPFAEGIYALTTTGRDSHLAYQITVPSTIGEIQKELGLNEKGSYVVSVKNPETPSPANFSIDNPAKYPEEIQKKFRGLRWMPLEPEVLEYDGTQFLIIGEGLGDVGKAAEGLSKDKRERKEKLEDELEKLGEEDHDRVEHLKEDDPVFADLGLSSKEYPHMQTTW